MIALIELLKKNPKMNIAQFHHHYENVHAKLVHYVEHLIVDYQRNYPIDGFGYVADSGVEVSQSATTRPAWDSITQMTFSDIAAFGRVQRVLLDPKIKAEVEDDEEIYLDRSKTKVFICEQHVSPLDPSRLDESVRGGGPRITLIDLHKKNPALTDEQFRDHYENVHAKFVDLIAHLVVDYQRNYPLQGYGYDAADGIEISKSDNRPKPEFDCITKLTFPNMTALEKVQGVITDPALKAEIEADEAKFLNRNAIQRFICEQSVSQLKFEPA